MDTEIEGTEIADFSVTDDLLPRPLGFIELRSVSRHEDNDVLSKDIWQKIVQEALDKEFGPILQIFQLSPAKNFDFNR